LCKIDRRNENSTGFTVADPSYFDRKLREFVDAQDDFLADRRRLLDFQPEAAARDVEDAHFRLPAVLVNQYPWTPKIDSGRALYMRRISAGRLLHGPSVTSIRKIA
jgi:hypothetical protein